MVRPSFSFGKFANVGEVSFVGWAGFSFLALRELFLESGGFEKGAWGRCGARVSDGKGAALDPRRVFSPLDTHLRDGVDFSFWGWFRVMIRLSSPSCFPIPFAL